MFCSPGCSEKYFEPRNLQPHKYSNVDLFFRFVIHPTAIFDPLLKNDRNLKLASSILLFTNLYFVQRRPWLFLSKTIAALENANGFFLHSIVMKSRDVLKVKLSGLKRGISADEMRVWYNSLIVNEIKQRWAERFGGLQHCEHLH